MFSPALKSRRYSKRKILQKDEFGEEILHEIIVTEGINKNKKLVLKEILAKGGQIEEAEKEFLIMKKNIPNVAKAHDSEFDEENHVFRFTMEFYECGNLEDFILTSHRSSLPYKLFFSIFRDVLRGLRGLLKEGVVHRNLKPKNILLDKENSAHVSDISSLKICDAHSSSQTNNLSHKVKESLNWMAPEMREAYENKKELKTNIANLSVFSLGLLVLFCLDYERFNEKIDFLNKSEAELKNYLNEIEERSTVSDRIESKAVVPDLVLMKYLGLMLEFDVKKRPTILELYEDLYEGRPYKRDRYIRKLIANHLSGLNDNKQNFEGEKTIIDDSNQSFLILDLSKKYFDDYSAFPIFILLAGLENLDYLELDIRCSSITEKGLLDFLERISCLDKLSSLIIGLSEDKIKGTELGRKLEKLKNMKSLSLNYRSTQISEKGASDLAVGMGHFTNISSFSLQLGKTHISNKGVSFLAERLKLLKNLTNILLDFQWTKILDDATSQIGISLGHLTMLNKIILEFQGTKISDDGAKCLAVGIENLKDLNHMSLDFKKTLITDQGVSEIAKKLSFLQNLEFLSIYLGHTKISDKALSSLAPELTQHKNLGKLILDLQSTNISDEGLSCLATGFEKMTFLRKLSLDLQSNSISDLSISRLAVGIGHLKNLIDLNLDLHEDEVSDKGAEALATNLSKLKCLKKISLDISGSQVSGKGLNCLATTFGTLTSLINLSLYLGSIDFCDNAASEFMTELENLKGLTCLTLNLWSTMISDKGALYIADGLKQLKNLQNLSLDLQWTKISDIGASELAAALDSLSNLINVSLDFSESQISEKESSNIKNLLERYQMNN